MKIEAGKRYVRRDGEISGVITLSDGFLYDSKNNWFYTESGATGGADINKNLISEYIEPSAGLASRHDAEVEPDHSQDDLTRHANATDFISLTSDYQRGINDAVLWLVANYTTYKPEYLAENMLEELNND